jgi:hypothetical protein
MGDRSLVLLLPLPLAASKPYSARTLRPSGHGSPMESADPVESTCLRDCRPRRFCRLRTKTGRTHGKSKSLLRNKFTHVNARAASGCSAVPNLGVTCHTLTRCAAAPAFDLGSYRTATPPNQTRPGPPGTPPAGHYLPPGSGSAAIGQPGSPQDRAFARFEDRRGVLDRACCLPISASHSFVLGGRKLGRRYPPFL